MNGFYNRTSSFTLGAAIFTSSFFGASWLASGLTAQDAREAEFIFQSFIEGRSRLLKGHYRLKVEVGGRDYYHAMLAGEFEVWFDFETKCYRVDRMLGPKKSNWSQCVVSPLHVLVHERNSGTILRKQPGFKYDHWEHPYFDARLVGIVADSSLGSSTFEEFVSFISKVPPKFTMYRDDGVSVVQLAIEHNRGTANRTLAIEEHNGYVCSSVRFNTSVSGSKSDDVSSQALVKYIDLNDVFVPVESRNVLETGDQKVTTDYLFSWQQVNEEIGTEVFTIDGLGQLGGTLILDDRLGGEKPIVERIVPRDGIDDLPGGPSRVLGASSRVSWLFLCNAALLLLVLVAVAKRFLVKKR